MPPLATGRQYSIGFAVGGELGLYASVSRKKACDGQSGDADTSACGTG
jgi:hypothetical protein